MFSFKIYLRIIETQIWPEEVPLSGQLLKNDTHFIMLDKKHRDMCIQLGINSQTTDNQDSNGS